MEESFVTYPALKSEISRHSFWVWKWFIPTCVLWWREAENIRQQMPAGESLSICPSVSLSVPLWMSAAQLSVCCMLTFTEVNLLVLCVALRKCSTPHSAGSSKGGVRWRRSHASCKHSLSLSAVFVSRSLTRFTSPECCEAPLDRNSTQRRAEEEEEEDERGIIPASICFLSISSLLVSHLPTSTHGAFNRWCESLLWR